MVCFIIITTGPVISWPMCSPSSRPVCQRKPTYMIWPWASPRKATVPSHWNFALVSPSWYVLLRLHLSLFTDMLWC
jgi:hypothetical protein